MTAYEQILYAVEDGVATITLNRPEKLNAFTNTMRQELIAAFDAVDADDDVRAVIVTGAGRAFCAGADLSAGSKTFDYAARGVIGPEERRRDGGGTVTLRIFACKKPVIAAVNGPAVGIGATMQLPMDIRLAADGARFGFVFTRRGVVPEACSSWFLPRLVGIQQALDWTLTGRVFDAAEAKAGGLVKDVLPLPDLLPAARQWAREIVIHTSAVSVALTRQMLWRMLGAEHPMAAHRIDSRGIQMMGRSPDAYEGVASFLEKRQPRFTMKPSQDMPEFFPWWTEPPFA
jgi:enoyl-CoA hydratase/carnithine racemase